MGQKPGLLGRDGGQKELRARGCHDEQRDASQPQQGCPEQPDTGNGPAGKHLPHRQRNAGVDRYGPFPQHGGEAAGPRPEAVDQKAPEQAETLRNQILYLNREDVELEEGTYFIQDLIGLDVIDADNGTAYGTLKDVLQTGANDVYVVQAEGGKELLIPAIPDVIVETNIEEHCMKIRPLEGLLDAN